MTRSTDLGYSKFDVPIWEWLHEVLEQNKERHKTRYFLDTSIGGFSKAKVLTISLRCCVMTFGWWNYALLNQFILKGFSLLSQTLRSSIRVSKEWLFMGLKTAHDKL